MSQGSLVARRMVFDGVMNEGGISNISTGLRCGSFLKKHWKKALGAIMIKIITFANQIFV